LDRKSAQRGRNVARIIHGFRLRIALDVSQIGALVVGPGRLELSGWSVLRGVSRSDARGRAERAEPGSCDSGFMSRVGEAIRELATPCLAASALMNAVETETLAGAH